MCKLFLLILTLGLVAQHGYAQSEFAPGEPTKKDQVGVSNPVPAKSTKRRIKRFYFDLGGELRSYTYEEPGFVKHSGIMPGIRGDFISVTGWGGYGVDGSFAMSNSNKYDGAICEDDGFTVTCSPYETNKQTDLITKTSGFVYLKVSDVLRFKGGIGYRYLSNSVPEPGFYLRTGSWFYIPVGLEILNNSDTVFKWKYSLSYDQIVSGGIKSDLSNVSTQYHDVYMAQTGYGLNMGVELRYRARYVLGFFYETWNLNRSDDVDAGGSGPFHEPANKATSIGVSLGYDFY